MDRQALRERLMATFLGELEEHVETFTRDLLTIEQEPARTPDLVASLFRAAHSLKGAARSVNLPAIEAVCHQLETLLGGIRQGRRGLDADVIRRLFAATRALADAVTRLRAHTALTPGPLEDVLPLLTRGAPPAERMDTPAAREAAVTAHAGQLPAESPSLSREGTVRVPAETLDMLLAGSGELLVARRRVAVEHGEVAALHEAVRGTRAEWQRLVEPLRKLLRSQSRLLPRRAVAALERTEAQWKSIERRLDQVRTRLQASQHALDRAAETLDDGIRRARLFPFSQACEGLALAVRDLTRGGSSTPIDVVVEGGDIQLDRFVLEGIRAPLLQLVRNAVAHGIETPDERRAAGKPARATITVTATVGGDAVEIAVNDDGRGLALEAVRSGARDLGLPEPASESEALALIFRPGFSTARRLTEVSGRGVGLDIVKHQVKALRGHVDARVSRGAGLQVVMQVPLTLTTLRALLVRAGGQTFAVPVASVRRLLRVAASAFVSAGGRDMLLAPNAPPIPAAALVDLLGIDAPPARGDRVPVVLIGTGRVQAAIVVQELLAEEELLVKPLGPRLQRVAHVSGATILPSGHVALILNATEVVQTALLGSSRLRLAAPATDRRPALRRLVLADDSVTTRTLERTILEAAGYEVLAAVDGAQAWELLQTTAADLVVADVEMPRMDGFELCEAIRASARLRDMPVVLVTARESDADRRRGLDAGADAYLPKSSFDQQLLLDTVGRLL